MAAAAAMTTIETSSSTTTVEVATRYYCSVAVLSPSLVLSLLFYRSKNFVDIILVDRQINLALDLATSAGKTLYDPGVP